jgi:Reverse transcriptase (RNA-dependent DNA polymerase)
MTERINKFNIGIRRRQNSEYTKLTRLRGGAKEARTLGIPSALMNDPLYKRMRYVRYADDFLIGIIGSLEDANNIVKELHVFLENNLKLELNLAKTKVTHASLDKAFFLGT